MIKKQISNELHLNILFHPLCLVLSIAAIANSKIVDPEPLVDSGIRYQSHENYIEAIDTQSNNTKWHSELYSSSYPWVINPFLEEDVQWNIIGEFKFKGDTIVVRDCKGNQYFVQKSTGKLLRQIIMPQSHYGMAFVLILIIGAIAYVIHKLRQNRFVDIE